MFNGVPKIITKYAGIFISITVLLFILIKFIPENIIISNYGAGAYNGLGLKDPVFIQYFYFLFDLITGNMGSVNIKIYTGNTLGIVGMLLPETLEFLLISFLASLAISYKVGVFIGTKYSNTNNINVNVFPFLILYLITGLILLTIFSGLLGIFPLRYIIPNRFATGYPWIGYAGNGIFITKPTNIIMLDSIINGNYTVLIYYVRGFILPFIALIIPSTIYLCIYISRLTSIEYNKDYLKIAFIRGLYGNDYIKHIKRNIDSTIIREMKPVFILFIGGMIIISYIYSYMNIGEFVVYSFLNYNGGLMGAIYGIFILIVIILIFDFIIDLAMRGKKYVLH